MEKKETIIVVQNLKIFIRLTMVEKRQIILQKLKCGKRKKRNKN